MSIVLVLILSLTLIGVFSSCNKEEKDKETTEYTADIVGKWKLIAVYYWDWEPLTLDYSQNGIIYDFNENNELIVFGEIENIDDYRGHEKGKHSYKVLPIPVPADCLPSPQIEIDSETHGFSFGWVFYDFYEGSAMHLNTKNGTLVLVRKDETVETKKHGV